MSSIALQGRKDDIQPMLACDTSFANSFHPELLPNTAKEFDGFITAQNFEGDESPSWIGEFWVYEARS